MSDPVTRITIIGAKGRMGQMLGTLAARDPAFQVVGQIDQGDAFEEGVAAASVVIDFSTHRVTGQVATLCAARGKALVIGTTGHDAAEKQDILRTLAGLPVVWSANYATGVNVLFWLTRKAVEALGPAYDLEVVEMHHRRKLDAPSGTAATLAEILADARGEQLAAVVKHGRRGITGERTRAEIGLHSLRGGDVIGDHTVVFATDGERLELTHRASTREVLAAGALRAARWIAGRSPGLYTMQDVLGLS